ncbi:Ras- protein Rab-12 [Tritrichomonas musculus]|uniref:Ras- protein Rab-12 n=1 Tax=Tritrichomonas musculus TaxID=1915356 RepID=A0ABR2IQM5_9EUKA
MDKTKFTVVFLGSTNVGKTCLFESMIGGSSSNHLPTTKCSSFVINREYSNILVSINLWDTAGQEKFRSITIPYVRSADGIFLVYDMTDIVTFDELDDLIDLISHADDPSILLIGNKKDLITDPNFVIPNLEVFKEKVKAFNSIETSALLNINVEDAIILMIENLMKKKKMTETKVELEENPKPQPCC